MEQASTYTQAPEFLKSYPFSRDTRKRGPAHGIQSLKSMISKEKKDLFTELPEPYLLLLFFK